MNVGFIGAGNMGGALARAIRNDTETKVYIYDTNAEKATKLASEIGAIGCELSLLLTESDFIFLGVKPNVISAVCEQIRDLLKKNTVLISMAAGVKLAKLDEALNAKSPVIRIMPNTPVTYGVGMTAWCKNSLVTDAMAKEFERIMAYTGAVDNIPEDNIDAFCAIAGCGPAYAYMFVDALAKAGENCGLDRERALFYASKMLAGAATMAEKSPLPPKSLCENVCSPGGSTIEGVKVLEAEGFDATVQKAIVAAYNRTKELGKKN